MDLEPFVESIQYELVAAAQAGGEDARALAQRLLSPLESAIRLTLQDALVAAVDEITCDLAPGSVELRLRGRDPEFVVTPPPPDPSGDDASRSDALDSRSARPLTPPAPGDADDSAMSRINLRMPDQLKARVEQAASGEGVSVNSWLVRAATAALERLDPNVRRAFRAPRSGQRYKGWAR
jgi:hypothetical protein